MTSKRLKKVSAFKKYIDELTSWGAIIYFISGVTLACLIFGTIYQNWLIELERGLRIITYFFYLESALTLIKKLKQ